MMPWFADTFFFLALRNPRDGAHERATAITLQYPKRKLVTTAWVLAEVADALAAPANRQGFGQLLDLLRANAMVTIISPDSVLFDRGVALYRGRHDKDWSLTDCISFVVMQEHGLSDALTGDHHFEQAGFSALLK